MFSRAIAWVGLCCVACGGEARTAAAPPPKPEPVSTPVADSSEPIALVTPPPTASAEDAEPPMPSDCKSKPLPRGNDYSVEARVDVNSASLTHRWAFSVN